jgi:hypothetical protein
MQDIYITHFPNQGFLNTRLTEEQLRPVVAEIEEVKNNFENAIKANDALAGNILQEYRLPKSRDYLEKLIFPFLADYDKHFNYTKYIKLLDKDMPMRMNDPWVNFQRKHEFNPIHDHSGIYSWVIWISIPYSMEDEIKASPGKDSADPVSGHFEFQYTTSLGAIQPYKIPADKTFENTLILFPSKLTHQVYPFYSSDSYRISLSGNFVIAT